MRGVKLGRGVVTRIGSVSEKGSLSGDFGGYSVDALLGRVGTGVIGGAHCAEVGGGFPRLEEGKGGEVFFATEVNVGYAR